MQSKDGVEYVIINLMALDPIYHILILSHSR